MTATLVVNLLSTMPNPATKQNALVYLHQLILQRHLKQLQKGNTELKHIHDFTAVFVWYLYIK